MKKSIAALVSLSFLAASMTALAPTANASATAQSSVQTAVKAKKVDDQGHRKVSTRALSGDRVKIAWKKNSKAKRYIIYVGSNPNITKNVKVYKTKKTSIKVPLAKGSSAKSGTFTFVKVRAQYSSGFVTGAKAQVVKPKPVSAPKHASRAKVVSWNVRASGGSATGARTWENRMPVIANKINSTKGDIVALQEIGSVTAAKNRQWKELTPALNSNYKWVYPEAHTPRTSTGKLISQDSKLLYDSSKWKVSNKGTVMLPGGSVGQNRWTEWALFTNKANGKGIYVLSAHLQSDNTAKASAQRVVQARKIVKKMKSLSNRTGHQAIVAGDMNDNVYRKGGGNRVQRTFNNSGFYDAYSTKKNSGGMYGSYNGFKPSKKNYARIDYIFSYGKMKGSYSYKNVLVQKGPFPSDHNMQIAVLPY